MIFRYFAIISVAFLEFIFPDPLWAVASLGLFLWFVQGLFSKNPGAVGTMFSLYIQKFLILVSLVFIALGYRMPELGRTADGSVYSGYFCLLACAFMHLSVSTRQILAARFVGGRVKIAPKSHVNDYYFIAALAAATVTIVYLLLVGLGSGFALIVGADRFVYRAGQGWLFNVIVTQKPLLTALMGFVRFRIPISRNKQRALDYALAGLSVTFVLFGDKFLSLIVLISFYYLPWILESKTGIIKASAKLISGAIILGMLGLAITYFVYSKNGALDYAATSRLLFGRFTGQGQLWYVVMQERPAVFQFDSDQVSKVLRAVLSREADITAFNERTGVFYLISKFAPSKIWTSIITSQGYVQFTGALEPFSLLAVGHFGLIVMLAVCGLCAGVSSFYIQHAYNEGRLFGFLAGIFILLKVYVMLNQGAVWTVFGWWAVLYILGLVAVDLTIRTVFASRRAAR